MLPISYGLPVGFLERSPTAFCRYVGAEHDGTWWENAAILSTYEVEIFLGIFLNVTGQSTKVLLTCICISISVGICASHLKDATLQTLLIACSVLLLLGSREKTTCLGF